jgi:hypothetical protein
MHKLIKWITMFILIVFISYMIQVAIEGTGQHFLTFIKLIRDFFVFV